jgi:bifunctional ADP-heptose synthase (sugar kinase/adenylyltransferase)
MCPEAPVPVFNPIDYISNGGMAKNVQANVLAHGIECDIITNRDTIEKTRYVDNKTNQMILRVDTDDQTVERFNYKEVPYGKYDAVIISDYNKGFIRDDDCANVCSCHNNVFMDTKRYVSAYLPTNLKFLKISDQDLTAQNNEQIIVTCGSKGCMYMGKMHPSPEKIITQDVSGAGDTFTAALAIAITRGDSTDEAITFANKCACEVVKKRGVTTI